MNRAEFESMDPRLEQAMTEIRNDDADPAVVQAAADRVWARLAAAQQGEHIRGCEDFQALIPEYRAGRLSGPKATLLKDHLHECVACRRVYEGRVVTMPAATMQARRSAPVYKWAAAAVVVFGVGGAVWFGYEQYGGGPGRATVQAVNGTLYRVSADGNLSAIAIGSELPDGVEIRTAKDSDAMVKLRDGSVVELRERSGLSTMATASDLTVRLARGSIIVQAAKRRSGHLFVATADCRVAVTGTVFSVVSGVKGSRVSVVEGEVHVERENQDHVLHPGDQMVTSPTIETNSVKDDVSWSRNREKMIQQIDKLSTRIQQIHLPAVRYTSRLLDRMPAATVVYASVPNLGQYLGEAQGVFEETMAQSPELRQLWAKQGIDIQEVIGKLRAASEYLGEEIVLAGLAGDAGQTVGPVFVAETKKDGFPEFLKAQIPGAIVETRPGVVVFGPKAAAVQRVAAALEANSGFSGTPFHGRIADAYRGGAGILIAADLSRMKGGPAEGQNLSFFLGEQKEVRNQMEMRATLGFQGERQGVAAWLAGPAPMGSFDYLSPETTFVGAFVVKNPQAIVDQLVPLGEKMLGPAQAPENAAQLKADLISSLGGEFSVAFDGPIFPPSWKLIVEVYDPAKAQAALQAVVDAYNRGAASHGGQPLRTSQETFEGRTYYMIAGAVPNALTEAHYTFADGYLIAGPTRQLISKALQIKTAGTSITRSAKFLELEPRDHYTNYSAVVYENLGQTLAPLAGLLGSLMPPQGRGGRGGPDLSALGNMKPMMLAAYAEGDQITVAAGGNMLAKGMAGLLSGNVAGMFGGPMAQMQRAR